MRLSGDKVRRGANGTGGAFGGKEEYPSMIAGHAALSSMKLATCENVYDRMEDMAATTKRHPSKNEASHRGKQKGKILGGEIEFTTDGGAYASVVLGGSCRAVRFTNGGPYFWPSVRIRRRQWQRIRLPMGRFADLARRKSLFAMERHMDRIGEAVGTSPVEIRRRNFLKPGRRRHGTDHSRRIDLDSFARPALGTFRSSRRRKRACGKKNKNGRAKKESGSRPFCMARDSRAPANAI